MKIQYVNSTHVGISLVYQKHDHNGYLECLMKYPHLTTYFDKSTTQTTYIITSHHSMVFMILPIQIKNFNKKNEVYVYVECVKLLLLKIWDDSHMGVIL